MTQRIRGFTRREPQNIQRAIVTPRELQKATKGTESFRKLKNATDGHREPQRAAARFDKSHDFASRSMIAQDFPKVFKPLFKSCKTQYLIK